MGLDNPTNVKPQILLTLHAERVHRGFGHGLSLLLETGGARADAATAVAGTNDASSEGFNGFKADAVFLTELFHLRLLLGTDKVKLGDKKNNLFLLPRLY